MSNTRQIVAMLRSRAEGDDDQFYSIALQVAASAARQGHRQTAEDIRSAVDEARSAPQSHSSAVVPFSAPRASLDGLLEPRQARVRLSDVVLSERVSDRLSTLVLQQRCRDRLPPGSAVIVHSAVWHARRPKPGGERRGRYFIDVSYCQHGVLWPAYGVVEAVNREALRQGFDRAGRYRHLYDSTRFFDRRPLQDRFERSNQGSLLLRMQDR